MALGYTLYYPRAVVSITIFTGQFIKINFLIIYFMQAAIYKPKRRGYKKNPYRKSKMQFLRPYIPRGIYWTTFKFRTQLTAQCDANGTIQAAISAWALQGNATVTGMAPYYEAFKVVYASFDIQPNEQMTSSLGGTPIIASITHLDLATILAATIRQTILNSRYYKSINGAQGQQSLKLRWLCDPNDGDENQFTRMNAAGPANTNGGLLIYFDGPAGMANTNPLTITITYYCVLRGQGCSYLV